MLGLACVQGQELALLQRQTHELTQSLAAANAMLDKLANEKEKAEADLFYRVRPQPPLRRSGVS